MKSSVSFDEVWQSLLPLVTQQRVEPVLVRAGLDSIDVRNGACERVVRADSLTIIVRAAVSSEAAVFVFVGPIPYARIEVEAASLGWYVKRLAVRSSIYRLVDAPCRRMKLNLVADPALHALGHEWAK